MGVECQVVSRLRAQVSLRITKHGRSLRGSRDIPAWCRDPSCKCFSLHNFFHFSFSIISSVLSQGIFPHFLWVMPGAASSHCVDSDFHVFKTTDRRFNLLMEIRYEEFAFGIPTRALATRGCSLITHEKWAEGNRRLSTLWPHAPTVGYALRRLELVTQRRFFDDFVFDERRLLSLYTSVDYTWLHRIPELLLAHCPSV